MAAQRNYQVEDFLLNESFIEWILNDSEKDAVFWANWIDAHPGCQPAINAAKGILLTLHVKPARNLSAVEIDSIINNIENKAYQHICNNKQLETMRIPMVAWYLAAMMIICFVIGFIFLKESKSSVATLSNQIATYQNHTKKTMLVKLADGSSIILKPQASIILSKNFNSALREVSLNGEAFFEVHKDAAHPFVVHSGQWVTRVIGTSFTIKACNKTNAFKIIVNTGKVLVYNNLTPQKKKELIKQTFVMPNQQLTYNPVHNGLIKENIADPLLLSAEQSKELFTFHDTPLSKVIANIERAYNVNIIYDEKQLGACPLTASLSDEHLLEKLDLICKALDINYFITNGQISIQGAGCNSK